MNPPDEEHKVLAPGDSAFELIARRSAARLVSRLGLQIRASVRDGTCGCKAGAQWPASPPKR